MSGGGGAGPAGAPAFQPPAEVGELGPGALSEAAELLARAFRDNPLNRAVISAHSAEHRLRANRWGMQTQVPTLFRHGRALAARRRGRLAGVLLSAPPGSWPLPLPPWRERLRCLLGQGFGVASRWGRVAEVLHEHHEPLPHSYLALLGVEPAEQRAGVGAELLRAWLRAVDSDGSCAYLETDTRSNVAFYERAGFRVRREVQVLGARVWLMERPPVRFGES